MTIFTDKKPRLVIDRPVLEGKHNLMKENPRKYEDALPYQIYSCSEYFSYVFCTLAFFVHALKYNLTHNDKY